MINFRWFYSGACPTASAGSGTVTGYGPEMRGEILALSVEYLGSPPATTDVVISDARDPAADAILTLTNKNTDGKWFPRGLVCDDVAVVQYDKPVEIPIESRLKVIVTGANTGDGVNIGVWYRSP